MKLRTIFSKTKNLYKKILVPLLIMAVALPVTGLVTAQPDVALEGHTKSLNVTAGETEYKDTTNAKVDEVVQVQLWHHNREMPDAARAKNTIVKFSVPAQQGKTQVITGTTSADNSNTITDSTTVNLSLDRARIEYIQGTAKFRYNKGAADGDRTCETGMDFAPERCYATVKISDNVVSQGVNLDQVRGGPLRGCNAHHETVTIQVRVKADVVSVNKFVRHLGQGADAWSVSTNAKPGDQLEYLIRFKNEGNTRLDDVMVGDNLPKYNSYVNSTTKLQNGAFPNGIEITNDNITKGGINVGNYMPGSVGYVWFRANIDPIQAFEKCGTYDVRNVGIVRPKGMNEFYNTAQVLIKVECDEKEKPKPFFSCDRLSAQKIGARQFRFTTQVTARDGAEVRRYFYNFGDGTEEFTTDRNVVEHTYAEPGTYAARVRVEFKANGKREIVTSDKCAVTIKIDEKPKKEVPEQLPVTGVGNILGVFGATTAAGTVAHYIVFRRRG